MEIRPTDPSAKYGSLERAAAFSGLSVSTLERLVRHGQLASFKVGRRQLVELAAVDDMIRSGRVAPCVGVA